jgi:hypothetical protein
MSLLPSGLPWTAYAAEVRGGPFHKGLPAIVAEIAQEKRVEPSAIEVWFADNWLSNRIFLSHTNVVDHCCDAWNKLIAQPWTIMSVGLRDWAYGF